MSVPKPEGYVISCTRIVPGADYLLTFEKDLPMETVEHIRGALESKFPNSRFAVMVGLGRLEIGCPSKLRRPWQWLKRK